MLTSALPEIGTVLLAVTTVLYIRGLPTVNRLPGAEGRPIRFSLAVTILLAVSLPPWDEYGVTAHMVQHLVLFFVAAPLLGVARAGPTILWGLPRGIRRRIGRHRRRASKWLRSPIAIWAVVALTWWVWHSTLFYEIAARNALAHGVEHASFVAAGYGLWWWSTRARWPEASVLLCFTSGLHTVLLAALMTFATTPWYPNVAVGPWLDRLTDQHVAGAMMWVVGGLGYTAATLWAVVRALALSSPAEPDASSRLTPDTNFDRSTGAPT